MAQTPPIEVLAFSEEAKGQVHIVLARLEQGKWYKRQLFRVYNAYHRDVAMSTDRRYLYFLSAQTWVGELKEGGDLKPLSPYLYLCVFSPNGRYLLGKSLGGATSDLVMFDVHKRTHKILTEGRVDFDGFGWYPDSRHIWFGEEIVRDKRNPSTPKTLQASQVDILTGKQRKLSTNEARRINTDWGLMNSRFRIGGIAYEPGYAYSRSSQVRVVISPDHPSATRQNKGRQSVVVQWQDGRSRVALSSQQHQWDTINALDVSDDGRWVLLLCTNEHRAFTGSVGLVRRIVVVDTATRRPFTVFELDEWGRVGELLLMGTYAKGLLRVCQFASTG